MEIPSSIEDIYSTYRCRGIACGQSGDQTNNTTEVTNLERLVCPGLAGELAQMGIAAYAPDASKPCPWDFLKQNPEIAAQVVGDTQ